MWVAVELYRRDPKRGLAERGSEKELTGSPAVLVERASKEERKPGRWRSGRVAPERRWGKLRSNVWRQWRAQRVHCTPGLGWPLPFGRVCVWVRSSTTTRTAGAGVIRRSSEWPRCVPEPRSVEAGNSGLFGVRDRGRHRGCSGGRRVLEYPRSERAGTTDGMSRAGERRGRRNRERPCGRGAGTCRTTRPTRRRDGR